MTCLRLIVNRTGGWKGHNCIVRDREFTLTR